MVDISAELPIVPPDLTTNPTYRFYSQEVILRALIFNWRGYCYLYNYPETSSPEPFIGMELPS